jgi:hypothetical protein
MLMVLLPLCVVPAVRLEPVHPGCKSRLACLLLSASCVYFLVSFGEQERGSGKPAGRLPLNGLVAASESHITYNGSKQQINDRSSWIIPRQLIQAVRPPCRRL